VQCERPADGGPFRYSELDEASEPKLLIYLDFGPITS